MNAALNPQDPLDDFFWWDVCWYFLLGLAGLLLVGACAGLADAQCGPNGCSVPAPNIYEWRQRPEPEDAHVFYLYLNGRQIGGWNAKEGYYRSLRGDVWGGRENKAPIEPPNYARKEAAPADWRTGGVDVSRIGRFDGAACWSMNGRRASEVEVYQALLEDDSQKPWLVVIGDEAARTKYLADFQAYPGLAALQDRVRVWSVVPTHFSLLDRNTKKAMFDVSGNPSVYLMLADGQVVYAQTNRSPNDLEAIRKADPDFRPPLPRPAPTPGPDPAPVNPTPPSNIPLHACCVLGAMIGYGIYLQRKGRA